MPTCRRSKLRTPRVSLSLKDYRSRAAHFTWSCLLAGAARRSVRAGVAFLHDNITPQDGVPVDPLESPEEIEALSWPGSFWRWRRGEQGDDSAAFADAHRFAFFNPVEHTPKVVPQLSHGSRFHVPQERYTFCTMSTRPSPARRELQVSADTVPILPALYQPSRLPSGGGGCPRKPQAGLLETESRRMPRAGAPSRHSRPEPRTCQRRPSASPSWANLRFLSFISLSPA